MRNRADASMARILKGLQWALHDIRPWEVSLVDRPAVDRSFLMTKREGGEIDMNDELKKMLQSLGVDPDKFAAADAADVSKAVAALEKAAADGDEEDEDGDGAGESMSLAHKAIDLLRSKLPGTKQRVAKSAGGDGHADDGDDEPEADPRVAELEKRVDEQDKELKAERERGRVEKAMSALDTAVAEGRILPAVRDTIGPVVEHFATTEAVHISKAEDGSKLETPLLEVLVKALEHDAKITGTLFREVGSRGSKEGESWKEVAAAEGKDKNNGGT